tara:strand:+ start:2990 stop:3589 length:600 start_codon:yes stop_codon:yes gene_type:complete
MPFWSSGQVEPKRQFRFLVSIPNMSDAAQFYARSVSKPAFTVTQAQHKFLNHTFYYPGKVEWNTVTVSLVDPVSPDATGDILSILRRSGYNVPSNLDATSGNESLSTIGKGNANAALGEVVIRALDEDGNFLEEWRLNNPFIVGVSFNNYDYSGEELSTVDLELRYDWASYVIPDGRPQAPGGTVLRRLFTPDNPTPLS